MNRGRTIHAFDAGMPSALRVSGLAARFHAWRGVSGRRYLATVHAAATAPAYQGAVIVLARAEADGTRVALWAGRSPASPAALARLAQMKRAEEVHVHLIAESEADRAAAEADLSTVAPQRASVPRSLAST
ncbi:MAG: hypothetical protein Q8O26_00410 [Phreatobacter sp.]|uniref:hypothetical protein n=1 Tax=Phreatobacter sp. TaxID=1966341 RepID=UPI002736E2C3|nr:hypothetical protein [Phreatobacter sp.]MDP2800323.1 hypothetical protein [Phreatobacter sp.]